VRPRYGVEKPPWGQETTKSLRGKMTERMKTSMGEDDRKRLGGRSLTNYIKRMKDIGEKGQTWVKEVV